LLSPVFFVFRYKSIAWLIMIPDFTGDFITFCARFTAFPFYFNALAFMDGN